MSALTAHRSLGGRLRSELYHNICLLSLRRPMLEELCRMLSGGSQTLDKLNQVLLIHLSYYLASIIDPKMAQVITWPLYDKASERTYKTQLLCFLSTFCNKNGSTEKDKWITPIQPSYLNAGGFKVMQLLFEMSQLALSRLIRCDFKPTGEKLEGCDLSAYLKDRAKLDIATNRMRKQFTDKSVGFVAYKKKVEIASKLYKNAIEKLEDENEKLTRTLHQCVVNSRSSEELKDIHKECSFLVNWNNLGDRKLSLLEEKWSHETQAIVRKAVDCRTSAKSTVGRSTLLDKSPYLIEYIPGKHEIEISDLETQVSSQQRYILKNIVKNDVLSFPTLVRGYAVAVCYLFKNVRCSEDLSPLCELAGQAGLAYTDLLCKGKWLIDGMHNLEIKLKDHTSQSSLMEDSSTDIVIPPLPDLKIRDEPWQHQLFQKTFTPLRSSKIRFSIRNGTAVEFRQPRSLFLAPLHAGARQSIFKNIAKLHTENMMNTFNSNVSTASSTCSQPKDFNRTTADCSAGFTKEQVLRLLSSRKSSSKKHKPRKTDSQSKAKRGSLFIDTPENSFAMARSVSSPNLVITTETKKNITKYRMRSLYAIAQEESPDRTVEMSGVAELQTSTSLLEQNGQFKSMPTITISKPDISKNTPTSSINGDVVDQHALNVDSNLKTPNSKNVPNEKKKSDSIERLIEKYKRIRCGRKSEAKGECPSVQLSPINDISTKENNINDINTDSPICGHLPDLVSPSINHLTSKCSEKSSFDSLANKEKKYKCRESLGAALGVDNTFLDQFEMVE